MSESYTIAIGTDHGAVELKDTLVSYLQGKGHTVIDCGINIGEKADYPDIAAKVVQQIMQQKATRGILLCGTGIGISMAANRFPFIRAALCHDEFTARLSRAHNDANILVLGGRTTGVETAKGIVDVWFNTAFDGDRHTPRVHKIDSVAIDAWEVIFKQNISTFRSE